MKKITLSIGLLAGILTSNAQDTICTYFKGKNVYEFDYYMDTILSKSEQKTKYYEIKIKYGDVLCLDLSDEKNKTRKIITTFLDGSTNVEILDSWITYYSPQEAIKVLVGRPKFIQKL